MSRLRREVKMFHLASGQPILRKPQVPGTDRVQLRMKLVLEEAFELLASCFHVTERLDILALKKHTWSLIDQIDREDVCLPELVDALGDMDYVSEGTRLEFGVRGGPVAREIHAANMTKFVDCPVCASQKAPALSCPHCRGSGIVPAKVDPVTGKILKPVGFRPPNIGHVLLEQGWSA